MVRRIAALLIGCLPLAVSAQTGDAVDLRARIGELIAPLEAVHACSFAIHGEPRYDEFTRKWLVNYSATGAACDEASDALRREALPHDVVFVLRPNERQVKALIADMRRSVESAFACRIIIRGEPRLNEVSSSWSVHYVDSGYDCDGAHEELGRLGAELGVHFVRAPGRRELLRGIGE